MTSTQQPTTITAPPATPFIEVVRDFDAPRELVFRASTDPEYVVQWLGPRRLQMSIEEWDARTGGAYRYTHSSEEEGFAVHFRGVFHTVRAPELVVQTFEFDGAPDEVATDTIRFEDLGAGRTRLTTRSVLPSVEARDMALESGMSGGIEESYDRLAELLNRLS